MVRFLKSFGLNHLIKWILSNNQIRSSEMIEKETFPEDIRDKLRDLYSKDTSNLEKLIGRNLSLWK